MTAHVEIFSDPDDLAKAAAFRIAREIKEAEKKGIPSNIAVSGGETPRRLFTVLAEKHSSSTNWDFVRFFWVDERCVPPNDPESNFGTADRLLFSRAGILQSSIHRIIGEAHPEKEAARYSKELRSLLPNVNGIPSFDLILLGMGNDGHTASIFPGRNDLFDTEEICTVTIHPEKEQKRVTITGKMINNARQIIFLVSGREKSAVLEQILEGGDEAWKYPASHVSPVHGTLTWMTDKAAASLLKNKHDPPT